MAVVNEEVISERARIVQDDSGKYHYFRDDIELEKGISIGNFNFIVFWSMPYISSISAMSELFNFRSLSTISLMSNSLISS